MLEQIYGWIQNIAVYLIVISAVMHVIPGKDYRKYIRFFSGMVLILLLFTPLMKLAGMEEEFLQFYRSSEYEMEQDEIRSTERIREQAEAADHVWEKFTEETAGAETLQEEGGDGKDGEDASSGGRIKVGEISVGE